MTKQSRRVPRDCLVGVPPRRAQMRELDGGAPFAGSVVKAAPVPDACAPEKAQGWGPYGQSLPPAGFACGGRRRWSPAGFARGAGRAPEGSGAFRQALPAERENEAPPRVGEKAEHTR